MGPVERKDVFISIVNDDTYIITMPSARKDQRNRSGQGQLNDLDATQGHSSKSRDFDTSRRNVPVGDLRYPEDNTRRGRSGTRDSNRDRSHDEPGMWSPPEEDPWSFRDQEGRVEPRSSFSQAKRDRRDRRQTDQREGRSRTKVERNQTPPTSMTSAASEGRLAARDSPKDSSRLQRSASKDAVDAKSKKSSKKPSSKDSSPASQGPRDLRYLERDRQTMARVDSNGRLVPTNRPSRGQASDTVNRSKSRDAPSRSRREETTPRHRNTNGSVEIPMETARVARTEPAPPYTTRPVNYAFMAELHARLGLPAPRPNPHIAALLAEDPDHTTTTTTTTTRQVGRVKPRARSAGQRTTDIKLTLSNDLDLEDVYSDAEKVGSPANSSVGEVVYLNNFSTKSEPKNSPLSKENYSKRISLTVFKYDICYLRREERWDYADSMFFKNHDGSDDRLNSRLKKGDGKGLFFDDGRRVVDFILVYEEQLEQKKSASAAEERIKKWRAKFIKNLQKAGLQTEEDTLENEKKLITFVKLHAPWDVCCVYAEDLGIRAPLQAHPNPTSNYTAKILEFLHIPNMMTQDVPNVPLDYYTCSFKKSKLERFLGSDNKDTFFEDTHRHRILWEILTTTLYGKKKRAEMGVERLLDEGSFTAAYPLHAGPHRPPETITDPSRLNKRQVLRQYWARWGVWYKYQPLDHIREYFGEKIGIYFAWLGFYTAWLLPASVVGILVFLYGIITFSDNIPANEVCDSGEDYNMCPLCDEDNGCEYWYLSDVCLFVRLSYLFDHPGTVFYSVFVSFWGEFTHTISGDKLTQGERPRPEYAAKAPEIKENPITGINEPYFDPKDRLPRILSGIAAIILM
ncbi:anoctamin, partial [Elysia marginata]